MNRWFSPIALALALIAILLFVIKSNELSHRINSLEEKLTSVQATVNKLVAATQHLEQKTGTLEEKTGSLEVKAGTLEEKTGKLAAISESFKEEASVLENNPGSLIDVIGTDSVTKGFFNTQSRINKVQLRNRSRFNVRDIQIRAEYGNGVTATLLVPELLVAGETKWLPAHQSPWIDGERPNARLRVTVVTIIGK